jgi:plastocyanin
MASIAWPSRRRAPTAGHVGRAVGRPARERLNRRRALVPALVAVLALGACSAASTPAPASGSASVTIHDFAYEPRAITIIAGTTVTWTNEDATRHTVTADDGSFRSRPLSQGQTFSHRFASPGSYPYYCEIHTSMRGTITVRASGPPARRPVRRLDPNVTGCPMATNVL